MSGQSPEDQHQEWAGEYDPLADEAERKVLFSVLDSFKYVSGMLCYSGGSNAMPYSRRCSSSIGMS